MLSPVGFDVSTNSYTYKITNFDGQGKAVFSPGEIIYFTDQAHVEGVNAAAETDYAAQWGCGGLVCNLTDQNAVISAYIESPTGSPIIPDFMPEGADGTNIEDKRTGSFTIGNTGKDPKYDAMYDISIDFSISKAYTVHNYIVKSTPTGDVRTELIPTQTINYDGINPTVRYLYDLSQFHTVAADPDGNGGLSDEDGHLAFNDLKGGENFKFVTEYQLITPFVLDGCIHDINNSMHWTYVYASISYKNWNGDVLYRQMGINGNGYSKTTNVLNLAKENFTGPTDLSDGESGTFLYNLVGSFSSTDFSTSNAISVYKLTLPEGYDLIKIRGDIQSQYVSFKKENNYFLVTNTFSYFGSMNLMFDVVKHCPGQLGDKETATLEGFYYFDKDHPENYAHFGCLSASVYNHCQACTGLTTNGFTVERTTFGWKMPSSFPVYTYNDMYNTDANRVNRNTPGIRLNAALPNDKVQMSLKGSVTAYTYNVLHAQITYESPLDNVNFFQFLDGHFSINGNSYNVTPTISITDKNAVIDFDISGADPNLVSIAPGTTFELIANFRYLDNDNLTRGEHFLNNFRGQFIGISPQQTTQCLGFGANFYLLKSEVYSSQSSSSFTCSKEVDFAFLFGENYPSYSTYDFPGEYRPQAILTKFSATLPKGFVFNPNEDVFFCLWHSKTKLDNVVFSQDKKTITFTLTNNSIIPNQYWNLSNYYTIRTVLNTDDQYTAPNPENGYSYYQVPASVELMKYAYADQEFRTTEQINHSNYIFDYGSPNTQLSANNFQEGFSNKVSWPVHFCNLSDNDTYIDKAKNSWVAIELKAGDNSTVLGVPTGESSTDMTGYTYYNNGRALLVQLGDISANTCKTISIPATYKNCLDDVTQDIDLYASWACQSPLTVNSATPTIESVRDKSITLRTDKLSLRYKTSDMQWAVNAGAERVSLCDAMPFEIALTSTKQANMGTLKLNVELPPATSLVSQSGVNQPYYTYNGITNFLTLPQPVGNKFSIDVSSLLPNGELPGNTVDGKNVIKFGLSVVPNGGTGFDAGMPVKFNTTAKTNCGDDRIFDNQQKIRLTGLDLDDIAITVSGTLYQGCTSPANSNIVTLTFKNQLTTYTQSSKFEIALSGNITFGQLLSGITGAPISTETDVETGVTTLTFNFPDRFLGPQETKTITFSTTVKENLSFSTDNPAIIPDDNQANINVSTFMSGQVYSSCDGQTHATLATTGSGDGSISLSNIFAFIDIVGYNIQNPVCRNTRVRLKADITGDIAGEECAYLWLPTGQTAQNVIIKATEAMSVTVQVTAPTGCISNAVTNLSVLNRNNPLSDVEIKATFDCSVPSGTLAVDHTEGNQYQWIKDGTDIPGAIEPTLAILASGKYLVYVTRNSCGTASDEIPVNLNSMDSRLNISMNQTMVETGYNLRVAVDPWKFWNVYTWKWGDNTSKSTRFRSSFHSYSKPGTYNISVVSSSLYGCASSTNTTSVRVVKSLCASSIPVNKNNNAAFYLDNKSGRVVFRDPTCSNEIDFGCISGQALQPNLRRAVNASAVTYADEWSYTDDDFKQFGGIPQKANDFDIGKAGKWRPNANFAYYSNLSGSNINKDAGTFTLEAFNYKFDDCNNTSRWVRLNSSEYYNPSGILLQKRDAIGIPSSEKYGYNKAVVYLSAQNAEKDDVFFESFENTYSINGSDYFEDNMRYNPTQVSFDFKNFHAGKRSVILNNGACLTTRGFYFSQQVIQKGLLISCWVRVNYPDVESLIKTNLVGKLINEAGTTLAFSQFFVVAHVGDWFLVESLFTTLADNALVKEGGMYVPSICFGSDQVMNIDDIRIQPVDAKTTAYVFEPGTLKILTVFDDQLFGLYYQYDQEGKLIRKQVETEKGKRTVQETFYNSPKSERPVDQP